MSENSPEYPSWDEAPTTLDVIQELIRAHPDYRITKHRSNAGNLFVMLEYPQSGDFEEEAAGEFVKMVSELGDDDE